jgi:hypothetical protein
MRDEAADEMEARARVARVLGVPVARFDTGTRNSIPDALIAFPEGPVPLEVVRDLREDVEKQQDALVRRGHSFASADGRAWLIGVDPTASIQTLHDRLPPILAALPSQDFGAGSAAVPAPMEALGVLNVWPFSNDGKIHLTTFGGVELVGAQPPVFELMGGGDAFSARGCSPQAPCS